MTSFVLHDWARRFKIRSAGGWLAGWLAGWLVRLRRLPWNKMCLLRALAARSISIQLYHSILYVVSSWSEQSFFNFSWLSCWLDSWAKLAQYGMFIKLGVKTRRVCLREKMVFFFFFFFIKMSKISGWPRAPHPCKRPVSESCFFTPLGKEENTKSSVQFNYELACLLLQTSNLLS